MQTMEAGLALQKQIEEVIFLPGPVVLSRVPVLAAAVGSGAVCGLSCGLSPLTQCGIAVGMPELP